MLAGKSIIIMMQFGTFSLLVSGAINVRSVKLGIEPPLVPFSLLVSGAINVRMMVAPALDLLVAFSLLVSGAINVS